MVLNSLILVAREIDELFKIIVLSNFKKAAHTRAFRLVRLLMHEAIMDPRYFKLDTWLICCPYTSNDGGGLQLTFMYSVLGTLMKPICSAAAYVLVSCTFAFEMDDSSIAMSSAKYRLFKKLGQVSLWLTRVANYDSVSSVAQFIR